MKDNELKDKFILKLKHDNNSFSEEAVKNEEEMVKTIENQQKEIIELQKVVVNLKKIANNIKTKDTKNSCTQTEEKICTSKNIITKKLTQNKPSDETIKNSQHNINGSSTMNVGNNNLSTELEKLNIINKKMKEEIDNLKIKNDNLVAEIEVMKRNIRETIGPAKQTRDNTNQPKEPQQFPTIPKQYVTRKKILILSDQHGRNLNKNLRKQDSLNQFHVESLLKPGASYENILDDVELLVKSYTKADFVIVFAGANDFQNCKYPKMRNICNKMKLCAHTNFIFLSTPKLCVNKNNSLINKCNNKLAELLVKLNNYTQGIMSFIDINDEMDIKLPNFEICTKIANVIHSTHNFSKNLIFINTDQSNLNEHEASLINISDDTQTGLGILDVPHATNYGANKELISDKDNFLFPRLSQTDLITG